MKKIENRYNSEYEAGNIVGNVMEELTDTEMEMFSGGCAWYDVSCHGGNEGYFCTLTVECQRSCN